MDNLNKANDLFMSQVKSSAVYQQAIKEAQEKVEAEIAELEAMFPAEITEEAIEIGLASIDTYRCKELDDNIDKTTWINNNIPLSVILGEQYGADNNTIDTLSTILRKSKASTIKYILKHLGIKCSTTYQNEQKEYVDLLIEDFRDNVYDELIAYLKKAKLYDFYRALLEYIKNRISPVPLSNNKNELTFYVVYDDLRAICKDFKINRGITDSSLLDKLDTLCNLGLLDNLESSRIEKNQLNKAEDIAKFISNIISDETNCDVYINRNNHYVLNDLSKETQYRAINIIRLEKECHLRKKDKNSTTIAMVHGEEAQKKTFAQGKPNINPTKLKNFIDAGNILLKKQNYYTEEQLRIQYCKKDHSVTKQESIKLTKTYLSRIVLETNCIATRVNSKVRDKYKLPKKIKSNSFIYILKEE